MKILRYHYNDQECIGVFMNGNILLLPEILKGERISNDILSTFLDNCIGSFLTDSKISISLLSISLLII